MVFIAGVGSELHPLGKATVDHHVSASRKRRTGTGQKGYRVGDFIVGTHSPHRNIGDHENKPGQKAPSPFDRAVVDRGKRVFMETSGREIAPSHECGPHG